MPAFVIALIVVAAAWPLAGCKSFEQRTLPPEFQSTPLPLDPTDHYAIGRWWSNGSHLLQLDADQAYVLYAGTGTYRREIEHGRWWQQSYAVLWLEPYTMIKRPPTRVSVAREGDGIALQVPGLAPFIAVADSRREP